MSENTTIVARASDPEKAGLEKNATQYRKDGAYDQTTTAPHSQHSQHSLSLSLGYYAVGELSIGRRENALYAYRLLNSIEKDETRWKLGRAFCALELNLIDEAQIALEAIQKKTEQIKTLDELEQQKLLERCLLRLEYMQKQQKVAQGATSQGATPEGAKQNTRQAPAQDPLAQDTLAKTSRSPSSKSSGKSSGKGSGKNSGERDDASKVIPFPSTKSDTKVH